MCEALCEGLGTIATATELCVPADEVAVPTVGPSDLVVVGMPVYAGRVPALAVERLRCVETHGARCVVVAVYGNRAHETPEHLVCRLLLEKKKKTKKKKKTGQI